MRHNLILILAYALILQPALLSGCKFRGGTSSGLNSGSYQVGPAKTYADVENLLLGLQAKTSHWLAHREDGTQLDWSMENLNSSEKNRLWLHKLLEARERVPNGSNQQGIRAGIYYNKINLHIEEARDALQNDIKSLNLEYFKERLGSNDPLETQMQYLKTLEFSRYLKTFDEESRDKELEMQLSLLNTIDVDFKDKARPLMYSLLLNSGIIKAQSEDDVSIEDEEVLRNYWDGYLEITEEQLIELFTEKTGRAPIEGQLIEEIETLTLTTEQQNFFRVYKVLQPGQEAFVDISLEILKGISIPIDKEISENLLVDAFNESLAKKQAEADENILEAFPESMERLTKVLDGAETAAAEIKFALTSFLGFPDYKFLYGVIVITAFGLAAGKDWTADFSDPRSVFGSMIGITFSVSHIGALSRYLMSFAAFKSVVSSALSKVTSIIPSGISKLGIKLFAWTGQNVGQFFSSGILGKIGGIILKASPIVSVGMFLALAYEIYSLSVDDIQGYKKYLGMLNVGLIGSMAVLGVACGFMTIPGINIIFLVGTLVWFVVGLIKSYGPDGGFQPGSNDPMVKYYSSEINPNHSYWQWCHEDSSSRANCRKDIVADVLLKKSFSKENLLRSNTFGGKGGSNELGFHRDSEDGVALDPGFSDTGIVKIDLWRCESGRDADEVGLFYHTKRLSEDCSTDVALNCKPGKVRTFHMGCGTNKDHRIGVKSIDITRDNPLIEVKIFVTEMDVLSPRIKAMEFCTPTGCESTHENPQDTYKHNINFSNITTYGQTALASNISRGEIIGFHGKYGDTIDSFGIYLRIPGDEVYNPEQRDLDKGWHHYWTTGGTCVQGYNPSGSPFERYQAEGVCGDCQKYVSFDKLANGNVVSMCDRCSTKSIISGKCIPNDGQRFTY